MAHPGPLRSKQGCWTCRLRRKKCDERHPTCNTCDGLTITCYGYGAKPEWMDGGEREKKMAESIKGIVKLTSRRKGRFGFSLTARGREKEASKAREDIRLAPAPKDDNMNLNVVRTSSSPGSTSEPHGTTSSLGTSPEADLRTSTSRASHSPASELSGHITAATSTLEEPSAPTIAPSDGMLLMHFLDHVFPLQYPMYHPSILSGGRGWFLSCLLRTKPLYHAALALSSYHHGVVVYGEVIEAACGGQRHLQNFRGGENWVGCPAQERHIQMSLAAFQEHIENSKRWLGEQKCPSDTLGFMGGVVQLTYFELFAGRGDTWHIHLRAATDMFRSSYEKQAATLNLTDSLEVISTSELRQMHGEGVVTEDVATFRFLCGVLIWLDVLSSVTGGKTPRLLGFHSLTIASTSPLKLEEIIGVKNWVVAQIGMIATLHEWKMIGLLHGSLKPEDLEEKAEGIRAVIAEGLTADCLESLAVADAHVPAIYHPLLITRIFGLAASVYLHLVVYGFDTGSTSLAATMAEAMLLLRTHMPPDLMHAVVFPLYVLGCNAKGEEEEEWFRDVLGKSPVKERSMEHRGKLLPLMEKIWKSRRESCQGWSWQNNLLLSEYNLLLV